MPSIVGLKQKISFNDMVETVSAEKHNSDLLNLANALKACDRHRTALSDFVDAFKTEIAETEMKIKVAAFEIENGKELSISEVKSLYDRAHSPKTKMQTFMP